MSDEPRRLLFGVAVWGAAYVENFLTLALPSFLAPGNIPACAALLPVKFQIITRPEDAPRINAHPTIAALAKHAEVSVEPRLTPECFSDNNRYSTMSYANRFTIAESLDTGAILSILPPDNIISDGSLTFGIRRILGGDQAVIVAGQKGVLEIIAPQLKAAPYVNADGTCINIPSPDLVSLQVLNPHPIAQIVYWRRQPFSGFPSCIYWSAGKESMLARCFHLHPMFVDMSNVDPETRRCGTLDGDLIMLARIPPEKVFVAVSSDDMCAIEISSLHFDPMGSVPMEIKDKTRHVLDWTAAGGACRLHRDQFRQYAFMARGREQVDWDQVIAEADRDTEDLFKGLARIDREEEKQQQRIEKERQQSEMQRWLRQIAMVPWRIAGRVTRTPRRLARASWRRMREKSSA